MSGFPSNRFPPVVAFLNDCLLCQCTANGNTSCTEVLAFENEIYVDLVSRVCFSLSSFRCLRTRTHTHTHIHARSLSLFFSYFSPVSNDSPSKWDQSTVNLTELPGLSDARVIFTHTHTYTHISVTSCMFHFFLFFFFCFVLFCFGLGFASSFFSFFFFLVSFRSVFGFS